MRRRGDCRLGYQSNDIEHGFQRIKQADILRNMPRSISHDTLRLMHLFSVGCCVFSVVSDPLFFYIPMLDRKQNCIAADKRMGITACAMRTVFDAMYVAHIIFQLYATDYWASVSRGFRRGFQYLLRDREVVKHTLYLIIDILAILPLPQVVIIFMLPNVSMLKNALRWVIFCQYVFRFLRIYPIYQDVKRTSGTFFDNAWAGAALNLLLYMLASHLVGSFWYFFSIERLEACWTKACHASQCNVDLLYCHRQLTRANLFLNVACPVTDVTSVQNSTVSFDFGIFLDALKSDVLEQRNFTKKFLYCFWWSLRSLSSLGQGLETSSFEWEICFGIFIGILGLILFALIISNIQNYIQSSNVRVEEMRVRKKDREWWMSQRGLRHDLRNRIRKYEQYKWKETRGFDEDSMFQSLPKYLRRDVKLDIGIKFLATVPLFGNMLDSKLMKAICPHLKPILYTKGSLISLEGDRLDEMLFVKRGTLKSSTSFNSVLLMQGDFCGEELLTWALNPSSSVHHQPPISTWTVKAFSEVEVFALGGDDLRSIASRFPRLHSKQFRQDFRRCSQQWRLWAACRIQDVWRSHRNRRLKKTLGLKERKMKVFKVLIGCTRPSDIITC